MALQNLGPEGRGKRLDTVLGMEGRYTGPGCL